MGRIGLLVAYLLVPDLGSTAQRVSTATWITGSIRIMDTMGLCPHVGR
jgi:hypothetical protein